MHTVSRAATLSQSVLLVLGYASSTGSTQLNVVT